MKEKIINKSKKVLKQVLHKNLTILHSDYNEEEFPKSLQDLTNYNKELLNIHSGIGKRNDNKEFYQEVAKINEAYKEFRIEIHKYDNPSIPEISEYDSLHSGTPMQTKPFKPCLREVQKLSFNKNLFWYPATPGGIIYRQKFVDYLLREGFPKENLGIENVVFTCSTTHAFTLILDLIARPEDIILVTAPNYGLFAVEPERINARVEVIDLKEEDNFFVNKTSLSQRIDELNEELKLTWKGKLPYTPKVVAFLNMNPHNPIGNVMNIKNKEILEGIGDVCLEKSVFVIDDLVYRDLTFDTQNLALPLASIPKYFHNTISLFGLSKSFGLASFRAGAIVAPIPIVRGITSRIFETMDSTPILQCASLAGAFNGSNKRYREYNKYFPKIIKEYQYRLNFAIALTDGINTIKDETIKNKIIKDIYKYEKDENNRQMLLEGLPYVNIRKNTLPTSGFFIIMDFTNLKGKIYDNEILDSEFSILKFFYKEGKVKYLMGKSMSWPYQNECVGRVNFALEKSALINNFLIMNKAIRKLK